MGLTEYEALRDTSTEIVCARQYISGKENILYVCKAENLPFFVKFGILMHKFLSLQKVTSL